MLRVATIAVLLLASLGITPVGQAPASAPPSFAQVLAAPMLGQMGEPSVLVDASVTPARVWATAPAFGVYGSTDGGGSYSQFAQGPFDASPAVQTNGDASMARDANGVLYLAALTDGSLNTITPVQVSLDGGHAWIRQQSLTPNAGTAGCDRQWIGARGNGEAILTVRCGSDIDLFRTTDAGVTWTGPVVLASDECIPGPISVGTDGAWYFLYDDCGSVIVMRSADGISWTSHAAGARANGIHFPTLAQDAAGVLYGAWDNCGGIGGVASTACRVYVARSADQGAHWTTPLAVSDSGRTAVYPWIVAGAAGKVDVAFYETSGAEVLASPDLSGPTTLWDVRLAQSLDANAQLPFYATSTIAAGFHQGSICTSGLACVGPQNLGLGPYPTPYDRRVYDFFEARIDAAGNLLVAYPRDVPFTDAVHTSPVSVAPGKLIFTYSDLVVAKQTGGSTIV
ncbi:MAG: hypothetical protein QOE90_3679 [Thermoplasmata archaeon]|jgi:hypothetical protein|nr:hypothetical protein [Thermoplasmata archaeon]